MSALNQQTGSGTASRVTADSFRMLTARLKPAAPAVAPAAALAPAPFVAPAPLPPEKPAPAIVQQQESPAPLAPEFAQAIPVLPDPVVQEIVQTRPIEVPPLPPVQPAAEKAAASAAPDDDWSRAIAAANTINPRTETFAESLSASQPPEMQVPETKLPEVQLPKAPLPKAQVPETSAEPEAFALPSFAQRPDLAQITVPYIQPAPAKAISPAPAQPQPISDAPPVITTSRINAVLTRNDVVDQSRLVLPPILPPPEPVVKAVQPKPADPAIFADAPPIQAHPRRKIAPSSDTELEYVMRMVATAPSLDERAEYLEEAARYGTVAVSAAEVKQEPFEDLEQLAMQHMQAYEQELAGAAAESVTVQVAETGEPAETLLDTDPGFEQSMTQPDQDPALVSEVIAHVPVIDVAPDMAPDAERETVQVKPRPSILKKNLSLNLPARPDQRPEPQVETPSAIQGMSEAQAEDLARSLLAMMASGSGTGLPQERALASDTLLRLLPRLSLRPLVHLSDRLSMMDQPPHMIVNRLLMDSRIEVAGPLLENATSIPDQDLAGVIEEADAKKLRLLARRRKLSRALSDSLIASDNMSVLLTLVRNSHAEISPGGYLALTDYAARETELLAPLCTRADLPAPQAFELFWLAPTQLRRYLLSRFLTDSETLTRILKITMATQGETLSSEVFPDATAVKSAFAGLLAGQTETATESLASLAQINAKTIARILADPAGEPAMILLKALGYPRQELEELVIALQQSELGTLSIDRERSELLSLFDTLSFNKARILLTYWDWATLRSGPYAPVH